MSTRWMRCRTSRSRSAGKTRLTSQSRSACMSRNVLEMNTRTVRQALDIIDPDAAHGTRVTCIFPEELSSASTGRHDGPGRVGDTGGDQGVAMLRHQSACQTSQSQALLNHVTATG